ncbi:ATP-grasp enzyme [Patulibacter minatonensis]|uniref:ATP-grasp enzyme n=1 Tax=Patulibacter minatonensis TaxID=298163 RepID=UPI000A02F564|nr:ATP-grasp enzyme [Patulibacter minatonensis]
MLRSVAALGALTAVLPLNAAVTGALLLRRPRRVPAGPPGAARRTVLISGGKMTKALQLARSFHAAGHRVVLAETSRYRLTGHRFSRAVDAFHVVPQPDAEDYARALLRIVRDEDVDVYVPVCSPKASFYDALARRTLDAHCEVVHVDSTTIETLDDKDRFAAAAAGLGLPVPDTHRITDPRQVEAFDFPDDGTRYVLKSIAYDPVRRMDLTLLPRPTPEETSAFARSLPISTGNPWILQEFVEGEEFCTHSTVRGGRVRLHCCCRSSAFQLNYEHVDDPEIEAWVTRFVGALGLTGQASFDFIRGRDGVARAIECNPRTHSAITMFYDHPGVAGAYLEDDGDVVLPTASSRPTSWLYHEAWQALRHPATAAGRLRTVLRSKDAIFDPGDPLPFLLVHHLQIPRLILGNLLRAKPWVKVDFNIGKLVEPAGD